MAGYRDPALPLAQRVQTLLAQMTLAEKIGQLTQVEKNSLTPADVQAFGIGSVLSGGGGAPEPNMAAAWRAMVAEFQQAATQTRLGIPLLYGVDAVHGHNNVHGAVIFPHNVGLGAARNAGLVEQIARATAEAVAATGIQWNFAPTLAVPHDIRWGRTYEGFGEDSALVTELGAAYVRGTQSTQPRVAATAKHFIGDGSTNYGSSVTVNEGRRYQIDQGDSTITEAALRERLLPPYRAALAAGALTVMASFNSWHGLKLHAHHYLLTEVLKGELGFSGCVVSDWQALDQIADDYHCAVVTALNAGVDIVMVPFDYRRFIAEAAAALERGEISAARLDDAVSRILSVKFRLGLFEQPVVSLAGPVSVGGPVRQALARAAVRQSLVLLKNAGDTLPLAPDLDGVFVGGAAAHDIGLQCGGWTLPWQGGRGALTAGTTIVEGLRAALPDSEIVFDAAGAFEGRAAVGIAVVAEETYAEGWGDRADLALCPEDIALIERMRVHCERLVVVVVSGRPLLVTEQLPLMDALVAAWLPGTEGAGVADALCGVTAFTGRLPYTWPRTMAQLPHAAEAADGPLFPYGFGLTTTARV